MAVVREQRSALVALLLGSFFLSLYLLSGSSDLQHNGDTDLRYQTTQALVDHHRAWVASPMWTDERMARGRGGHLYVIYGPGQPVLMIPLYVAGKAIAHHLHLPYDITTLYTTRSLDLWLAAALLVVFYALARAVGYSMRVAAVLTLVLGLASVLWPDAQGALEQTQVDLFLLVAVYAVWRFVSGDLAQRGWMVVAGTGTGLAVFTRYDAAWYVVVVALYPALLRVRNGRTKALPGDWSAYGAGLLPWILLVMGWNYWRFGSPFHPGLHSRTFGEPIVAGFLGLIVSPGKGVLWYLPLIFLLPWGVPSLYRRLPGLTLFLGALVAVTVLFYSTVLFWHGDPAWGPRYLYAVVPYLILPLGELFSRWSQRARTVRAIVAGVILISAGLQVAAISVNQWRFWYRLEVMQQRTGQPFLWGATQYHYYWNVRESPILIQIDNVYQVFRLDALGDARYRLTARPDPLVSNPANNYPINTLAFWWADVRHPLLGSHTRYALAAGLACISIVSLVLLLTVLRVTSDTVTQRVRGDLELVSAQNR